MNTSIWKLFYTVSPISSAASRFEDSVPILKYLPTRLIQLRGKGAARQVEAFHPFSLSIMLLETIFEVKWYNVMIHYLLFTVSGFSPSLALFRHLTDSR